MATKKLGPTDIIRKAKKQNNLLKEETKFNLIIYSDNGVFRVDVFERQKTSALKEHVAQIVDIVAFEIHKKSKATNSRYGAIKCEDETGRIYDSKLELIVSKEFITYEKLGYIDNLEFQFLFSFKNVGLNRSYKADFIFDTLKDFTVETVKKPITFKAGEHYVCDVKSPGTATNSTFALKKEMMKVFLNKNVIKIIRRYNKPRKTVRKK